jgi:mono/diheme cytochrome c family protein
VKQATLKTTGPGQALCILTLTGLLATHAGAADKVTFDDNVLPIFRNNCLKCHNPNEAKGGLDLSNFGGAVKGGASGTSVASGDPDGSKLFRSITHAEEPTMPPNAKLPEKDIAVVRAWITGGLLETTGSKAIASNKPKIDMAVDPAALKPKEPLPMPQDLLLQPVVHTERASVATGMAHCPWAPLIALGGQRQVLLYNSDTLELAGILPFPEGYPHVVKFSRSGKLVLAGGGEGARQGKVAVWEIATGQRILTVGEEFDTVLAADLSGDQKWIALGGPDRLVKIYSTEDGQLKHSLKKHTDWVTSVEFSPDGKLLATGDRNGNLHVWEAVSGQELYNLKGHRDWITALSWRPDSEYLVSASEDGTAKLWKVKEEQQARSWNTHGGGALFAHVALDGRTVTCGRDNQVSIWDANAQRQRQIASTNDLPVRAVFNHEAKRVIVGDWLGNVNVYNAEDGKHLGTLSLNPPTLEQQLEKASTDLAKINEGAARLEEALKAAQAEAAKFAALAEDSARAFEAAKLNESGGKTEQEQLKEHKAQLEAANQRMAEAKQALEQTGAQRTTVQARIAGSRPRSSMSRCMPRGSSLPPANWSTLGAKPPPSRRKAPWRRPARS